tara:strand:- start:1915 stop:3117 length:1203 start_codon:yes stop_codon:yes gene_type:complete
MKKILPCVIGLGYVGLPVFISLKKKFRVIGFDLNKERVKNLNNFVDTNNEFRKKEIEFKNGSKITSDENEIKDCNFFIVTVPTPIKKNKLPDLKYIISAFRTVSKYVKNDDIIFLESTVFPGTTENICKKIIEKKKKIKFYIGYSSERINPGDKINNIKNINKVVAIKKDKKSFPVVKKIYKNISKKLIFSESIKESELSKLIENTQRDLNIALMNEIMILCHKTNLDFKEVIKLARSKWNFLKFNPGLVGGHCLPVDPYYLSYYAKKTKFKTKVTLAGRDINNFMEKFIFRKIYERILNEKKNNRKKIVIAGLTYKPNVADLRNSLAVKIFKKLKSKISNIIAYDPTINEKISKSFYIEKNFHKIKNANIFIFLVKHNKFKNLYSFAKRKNKTVIDPFA